jgi:hypothetical protein
MWHNPSVTEHETELTLVAEYTYRDENGVERFRVSRYVNSAGEKKFRQSRPDGEGGRVRNTDGIALIPYHLPEVLAASPQTTIYICEGEKDCDNLVALGQVATCNPRGAGSWRREFRQYFDKRNVVILRDNDEPGRKHGEQVAKSLRKVAASITIVDLPSLPEKGDVSDYLAGGRTIEDIQRIIEMTPQYGRGEG